MAIHPLLGGGFKYFLFSPRNLGKWSHLTCAYFSKGLEKTHQLDYVVFPTNPLTLGPIPSLKLTYPLKKGDSYWKTIMFRCYVSFQGGLVFSPPGRIVPSGAMGTTSSGTGTRSPVGRPGPKRGDVGVDETQGWKVKREPFFGRGGIQNNAKSMSFRMEALHEVRDLWSLGPVLLYGFKFLGKHAKGFLFMRMVSLKQTWFTRLKRLTPAVVWTGTRENCHPCFCRVWRDGWNPETHQLRLVVVSPWFTRFYTSQVVVWAFFHQQ